MKERSRQRRLQCIVSDMTAFYVKGVYYELTLFMDLWNNEIFSHALSAKRGDRITYIRGLNDLIELKKRRPQYEMILYSDQGAVYASKAFNDLLPMYSIIRSMSREGTLTDNAAMESIYKKLIYIRRKRNWALPKPTRGLAPGPHRLLKKAGENFTLGWAMPNPPGASPLDPSFEDIFGIIFLFHRIYSKKIWI